MCVRVADDLKLFDILSERTPHSMDVKAIATITGALEHSCCDSSALLPAWALSARLAKKVLPRRLY
jgi:hypothetical protein